MKMKTYQSEFYISSEVKCGFSKYVYKTHYQMFVYQITNIHC